MWHGQCNEPFTHHWPYAHFWLCLKPEHFTRQRKSRVLPLNGLLIINIYCIFRVEPGATFDDESLLWFIPPSNPCLICSSSTTSKIPLLFQWKRNCTLVTVQQEYRNCKHGFTWRSQQLLWTNFPAGVLLLSFAILMAGSSISISKIHLVFKNLGLQVYKVRTHEWVLEIIPSIFDCIIEDKG